LGTELAQSEKSSLDDTEGSAHRSLKAGIKGILLEGADSAAEAAKP
jgi:hypothetical protein